MLSTKVEMCMYGLPIAKGGASMSGERGKGQRKFLWEGDALCRSYKQALRICMAHLENVCSFWKNRYMQERINVRQLSRGQVIRALC